MRKLFKTAPLVVAVFCLVGSGSLLAELQPVAGGGAGTGVPALGETPLLVVLSNARISLVLDPEGVAQVRTTRRVEGVVESVELVYRKEAEVTTLERPADIGERLSVELTLGVIQPVRLEGSEVELTVEDRRPHAAKLPDPNQALTSAKLEVALTDSSARLVRVRDVLVFGDDCVLRLEATGGVVVLDLFGGSAEVVSHRGNLRISAEEANLVLDDNVGSLGFDLRGGELALRNSLAQARGTAVDSQLSIDGFEGSVTLDADRSTVFVRQLVDGKLALRGQGMIATVEGVQAPLSARFRGGSLTLTDYSGEARVQALAGAQVEATGGGGSLFLTLQEEVSASVRNFAGLVKAEMTGASLEVDGVDLLAATATRSRIEARRLGRLNRLHGIDAEWVLDLTGVTKAAPMKLLGETRARVALSSPCVVRTLGSESLPGEAAEVTGCDLEVPDQAPRRLHAKRRYGGQATVLNVEVGADAVLNVEGN